MNQRPKTYWPALAATFAIALGAVACTAAAPAAAPPDEDAYIAAIHTDRFDWLLPERPFIEEGYEACELLRAGHTEDQVAEIMVGEKWDGTGDRAAWQERMREEAVAARQHLCADA